MSLPLSLFLSHSLSLSLSLSLMIIAFDCWFEALSLFKYSQSAFVCILQHCLNFGARFESYLFTIYLFVRNMF